jgi:predicted esterase
LEFPANGVINHLNPTPCTEADSREYSYIEGVLDFIAGNSALDASKVYFEGFSQSSMFAAYVGVCFADRVAGIFQGGSGLAKTFHKPIVPGFQAQCSASVFSEYGRECCNGKHRILLIYSY